MDLPLCWVRVLTPVSNLRTPTSQMMLRHWLLSRSIFAPLRNATTNGTTRTLSMVGDGVFFRTHTVRNRIPLGAVGGARVRGLACLPVRGITTGWMTNECYLSNLKSE